MTDWYVYVVVNAAGVAYTGVAKDVAARVARHNAGTGAKFTRGRGPWQTVHVEGPLLHGDALRREMAIKRDAAFKVSLKARLAKVPSSGDFHADASALPRVRGAYVLVIELMGDVAVRLPGRPEATLLAGRYLYCGSARGPGGIAARVARHMRRDKTVRWHVDRLTTAGRVLGSWVFPEGDECALAARLSALPVPIPGFGSSDCHACVSHLFSWPEGTAVPFMEGTVALARERLRGVSLPTGFRRPGAAVAARCPHPRCHLPASADRPR